MLKIAKQSDSESLDVVLPVLPQGKASNEMATVSANHSSNVKLQLAMKFWAQPNQSGWAQAPLCELLKSIRIEQGHICCQL